MVGDVAVSSRHASGHKIVRNHKIVRLRILTSSLLANRRFVLNARGARSTEDQ
jgi:hypothetical protein